MAFADLSRSGLEMLATGDTLMPYDMPGGQFAFIEAYWRDPAAFRPDEDKRRDEFNAAMAPHYAQVRAAQEARWAREGDA